MPIEFACEACSRLLRVPDGSVGLVCECPACKQRLLVPDPAAIGMVEAAQETPSGAGQVRIPCPRCNQALICNRQLLGTKGQCRHCQYIFVISQDAPAASSRSSDWIFNCPKCQQLFEGKEEMRGRKGKCHACGEVFAIQLTKPESDAKLEITPASAATPWSPNALPKQTKPRSPSADRPQRSPSTAASGQSSPAPQSQPEPPPSQSLAVPESIQLVCTSCRGVMEVPGNTVGQMTACPFCHQLLKITVAKPQSTPSPSPASSGGRNASPQEPGLDSTPNPFGDLGLDLPSAPLVSEYASSPAFQAGPPKRRRTGSLQSGREPTFYGLPGILLIILGVLEILGLGGGLLLQFFGATAAVQEDLLTNGQVTVVITLALFALFVAMRIVQIVGGMAMARRSGLGMAKTGAILACIPCSFCMLINIPVGIWGIVVAFSGDAKRDFC